MNESLKRCTIFRLFKNYLYDALPPSLVCPYPGHHTSTLAFVWPENLVVVSYYLLALYTDWCYISSLYIFLVEQCLPVNNYSDVSLVIIQFQFHFPLIKFLHEFFGALTFKNSVTEYYICYSLKNGIYICRLCLQNACSRRSLITGYRE